MLRLEEPQPTQPGWGQRKRPDGRSARTPGEHCCPPPPPRPADLLGPCPAVSQARGGGVPAFPCILGRRHPLGEGLFPDRPRPVAGLCVLAAGSSPLAESGCALPPWTHASSE